MILFPTLALGRIESAVGFIAAIPNRNAMPPPKLSTDAPILQATHPVVVSLRPALGIKLHRSVDDADSSGILAGIFQKPLLGEARLDRHIGAFAEADLVFVILRLGKRPHFIELGRSGFASFKTIHAGQLDTGQAIHFTVRFEDVDDFQSVPLANIKVGLVVCWRDLQHACAKLNVDMLVGNDRQMRLVFHRQRPHRMFANQVSVARIVRVHRKPTVAGDGLRPRGRNLQPSARLLDDLHLEIIELAVLLLHDDLLVREGRQRLGAPVHHPLAAVDVPLFIEIHEDALHAFRVFLVHRETQPRPIARCAQLFQLLDDDAAMLLFPFPNMLEQFLATEIVPMLHYALLAQLAFDDTLRGDAGMVGAREPQNLLAIHTRLAGENVLNGVVEHMPHVQLAGDVWRRDDDRVRRPLIAYAFRLGRKTFVLLPE